MRKPLTGVVLTVLISAFLVAGSAMAQTASDIPVFAEQAPLIAPDHPLPGLPDTYGTSSVSYYMIQAKEFFPWSNSGYNTDNFGRGPRWTTSGGTDMVAPIHLPAGAKVIYMELDAYDNSASGQVFASLTTCSWTGVSCTYHPTVNGACQAGFICTTVASVSPNIQAITFDLTNDGLIVDNFNNQFSALTEPTRQDGTEKVAGVIIGYVLQVSPAPGVADFTDVPISHPFFRFVEALFHSGITAGCGGGNFCPDAPLTRGQMAVFLATALGLQWN